MQPCSCMSICVFTCTYFNINFTHTHAHIGIYATNICNAALYVSACRYEQITVITRPLCISCVYTCMYRDMRVYWYISTFCLLNKIYCVLHICMRNQTCSHIHTYAHVFTCICILMAVVSCVRRTGCSLGHFLPFNRLAILANKL